MFTDLLSTNNRKGMTSNRVLIKDFRIFKRYLAVKGGKKLGDKFGNILDKSFSLMKYSLWMNKLSTCLTE